MKTVLLPLLGSLVLPLVTPQAVDAPKPVVRWTADDASNFRYRFLEKERGRFLLFHKLPTNNFIALVSTRLWELGVVLGGVESPGRQPRVRESVAV